MKKERILALGAMFVGFMGIAMMGRTGHFGSIGVMDVVQLVGSGACVGAAATIFVKGVGAKSSGTSNETVKAS
jgi:hypothetical protein